VAGWTPSTSTTSGFFNVGFTARRCLADRARHVDPNALHREPPGFELDFEGKFTDTGSSAHRAAAEDVGCSCRTMGQALELQGQSGGFFIQNLAASVLAVPSIRSRCGPDHEHSPSDNADRFQSPQCPSGHAGLVTFVTDAAPTCTSRS